MLLSAMSRSRKMLFVKRWSTREAETVNACVCSVKGDVAALVWWKDLAFPFVLPPSVCFLLFLWSPCFSFINLPFKRWHLIFYIHKTPAALLPSLHRMSLWKKKLFAQPRTLRIPSNRCVSSNVLPPWCSWWSLWVQSPLQTTGTPSSPA